MQDARNEQLQALIKDIIAKLQGIVDVPPVESPCTMLDAEKKAKLDATWQERLKLGVEVQKLYAEGKKLHAEGNLIWAQVILDVYGNIKMKWVGKDCHLENGMIFKYKQR